MNSIRRAFERKNTKGWPKLFVAVDLHETIVTPTYNRFNEGATVYPGAAEVLSNWTKRDDVCIILWTSSHQDAIDDILKRLAPLGIKFDYINENPEQCSGRMCDFSRKWYMDIIIDDKGFFDAETDWWKVRDTLIELDEWDKPAKVAV